MAWVILLGALFVAFVNGANDNMKGVATLYGSGALAYRPALALATVSTGLGSLGSVLLGTGLVRAFSGKGLIPDAALSPAFLAAVALAGALTVLVATLGGLPVSTTHALLGGLAGAGLVAAGGRLNLSALGSIYFFPLLVSPLIAIVVAGAAYVAGRSATRRLGIIAESCICVGQQWVPIGGEAAVASRLSLTAGTAEECRRRYTGTLVGVSAQAVASGMHMTSAMLVGLARGFNDTPKILGLLVGGSVLSAAAGLVAVTLAMALGGLIAARRVAETMAKRITPMSEGQGLAGNLTTSLLVVGASRLGLPVSTTHVATGGIFGVGFTKGEVRWGMVSGILLAWLTTLPVAALFGAAAMWALRSAA